jgi:hypothetical protein
MNSLDVDPASCRIEVPADCGPEGLHDVIQILMSWADDPPAAIVLAFGAI